MVHIKVATLSEERVLLIYMFTVRAVYPCSLCVTLPPTETKAVRKKKVAHGYVHLSYLRTSVLRRFVAFSPPGPRSADSRVT